MSTQTDELRFLLKHSSIYGIGTILARAVAFLMLPLYTHYLTTTDYGVMELIDTTTGLIGIVVGLGISASISRFYYERESQDERNRLISTVYIMIAVATSALVLAASSAAPTLARVILDDAKYAHYFRVGFANLLLGVMVDVGQSYLRMLYKSTLFITISTLSLVLGVSLNIYFIAHLHLGVLSILYTSFIVRIITGVPLTIHILHGTGLRYHHGDAKALLKYSLPILPAAMGNALLNYSDRYFIKSFVSVADAGVYGLANKLGSILHTLVTGPFIGTFQPRRFEIAAKEPDFGKVLQTVFDSFFLGLLFLSLGLAVYTPEIMVMMTAPGFYRAGQYVPLLLITNLIFAMKYHVDFGIFQTGKTQYYMWANIITAAVQLIGAFFLVRAYGSWGAAFAVLLSTTVNFALLHIFSSRLYPLKFAFGRCAGALMLAVGFYFAARAIATGHIVLDVVLKAFLLAAYVIALLLVKLVSAEEVLELRALIRSILKRRALANAGAAGQ
jgi:O-antigen/teichoic acid export membrane protein